MADICELKVGGQIYGGWEDIRIQRGLEQISGQFSLQLSERWQAQATPRPVRCGQACVVTIGGQPVVTGWIDNVRPDYDDTNHTLAVAGRDKTGDLIDCSAIHKSGQWKSSSLKRIALDLLKPYGIDVVVGPYAERTANAVLPSFKLDEGESVFDCLERAARLAGVMMWTDGRGRLVIDLPGKAMAHTSLMEGVNILRFSGEMSWAERFSHITVKGQARGQHNSKGTASDTVVSRYRPLIVLAEDQAHGPNAQQRAAWEATVRAGRGNRATVRVRGWHQDNGVLWAPGLRVTVYSPTVRLDGEMLIVSCSYLKNAQDGTVCDLEITDPRAYDRLAGIRTAALKAPRRGKGGLSANQDTHKQPEDWSTL